MARIIEAKAVISGEDRTGKAFDSVARKLKDIGKGAKASVEIDRLNKSLADAKRGLEAIDRLRSAQTGFGSARTKFRTAQEDVARLAKELAGAREAAAQFDGIKAFSKTSGIGKEIADARHRVGELETSLKAAQRAVKGASAGYEQQVVVLKDAKQAAEGAGVSIRRLAEDEARLKRTVGITNDALARQAQLETRIGHPAAGVATGAAAVAARSATAPKPRSGVGLAEAAGFGLTGASALRMGAVATGIGGGAVLVGEGLRRAARSSMEFERSMIEVGKATDASGPELEAYGESVLKLARETGKAKGELASMLSSAGFAGRPKEELVDFTEYAAKATVAWQTGAEETGQALAELGNIYEANQKRIEEMGDAINTMADNSASKETDLLEFARRAGASGRTANIPLEQLLPFGAAMKEVGVRNETAGTPMEALLNVMKLGEEFSKSAKAGLDALGVNSDKMRKAFVAKPVEAMLDLLNKIDKLKDPLKKAEIMTDLFGKEYQDDMAKLMNALPKITQYFDLLRDKSKIAAGGVRFQFAQNLDKDVSKIDRATQSIDVLFKRLGDPIKVQAGGIAGQINTMVDRLEMGDTVVQRLIKRLRGADEDGAKADAAKTDKPEHDAVGRTATAIIRTFDPKFGRPANVQAAMDANESAGREVLRERMVLAQPAEIEARIRRQRGLAAEASGATGMRRSLLAEQSKGSGAEIARLEGELAKAWEAIGGLRLAQKRDRGAFGLGGATGKDTGTIGRSSFGFGVAGSDVMPSRNVPIPPQRPPQFGGAPYVPLPPGRPAEFGRVDQRIEATVAQPIPVTVGGEMTGRLDVGGTFKIEPSPLFTARMDGLDQKVASLAGKVSSLGSNGPGSTGKSSPDAGKGGRD